MAANVNISQACNLAFHALAILADNPEKPLTTAQIADRLQSSKDHLSKVLQRLNHADLVIPLRGPAGGFTLAKPPENISLLEIYETIDGPFHIDKCLFNKPLCKDGHCVLGHWLQSINQQLYDKLQNTTLACLSGQFQLTR